VTSPTIVAPSVAVQQQPDALQKLSAGLVVCYLFLLFSHVQDMVYYLHLPLVMFSLSTIVGLLSGSLFAKLKTRPMWVMLALTVWIAIGIPFSVWPGGAAETFSDFWVKAVLIFILVTGLIRTIPHIETAMAAMGFGTVTASLIVLSAGSHQFGDRIASDVGRFSDANDFAQFMLMGMCVLCAYATKPGRSAVTKIIAYAGLLALAIAFSKTGSRGGFIGLLVVLGYAFWKGSAAVKARIIVLAVVGTLAAVAYLPSSILMRYALVFGIDEPGGDDVQREAAEGSAEGRRYLFDKSIAITFKHPVLGVGAGMFAVAENELAVKQGQIKGAWHQTHNMYTQVSSELGIPGFILFMTLVVYAFRSLGRVMRMRLTYPKDPGIAEAAHIARWLRLALIGMATSGLFLSVAYTQELYILLALSLGIGDISQRLLIKRAPVQPAAVPVVNRFGIPMLAPAGRFSFGSAKPKRALQK
jgi:O-antigen ligase